MNRLWLIGGLLVLVAAVVIGLLNASSQGQLDMAVILADVAAPGCNAPGQVHLTLGNAADRAIVKVEGVIAVADASADPPKPVGNFEMAGPIAPGQKSDACVGIDEGELAGRERTSFTWIARATAVEFGEPASR